MTTHRDHFEICLGKDIQDLIPLISEALAVLDKPGTRALRRKIDKAMNSVVWGYGTIRRCTMDESEWDALRPTLPRYERATDRWPAQQAHDARKAAALAEAPAAPPVIDLPGRGLRVVVDNTKPVRRAPVDLTHGGAA